MTSTEVDKTGASYYGKQTLHYLSTKGETSMVMLSMLWSINYYCFYFWNNTFSCLQNVIFYFSKLGNKGPIHAVQWSPKNNEFCVIYDFMPAKATLFNLKCEPIFEFGALHRNSIYYNPQGNNIL